MRRRPGVDALLAVVLPVACALALYGLRPDRTEPGAAPPVETPLASSTLTCPGPVDGTGTDELRLGDLAPGAQADGDVRVGQGETAQQVRVRAGRTSTATPGDAAVVVTGTDDLAPGLVAGRSQTAPLAAADCAPPVAEHWFTAVGAGATHDSVLELVNPNAGPATADVTVRTPTGVVEVPALRGVQVPGGTTTRLDLGQIVPRQGELALEVRTERGRLGVHVLDSYDELGAGARSQDWLPAQDEPATTATLLGLVKGEGERRLVLANPGADEVRVTLQLVTPTSVLPPSGVDPVRVAPDSTAQVSLDDVLAQAADDGATGVLVEASGPVTAALRQVVGGDLSLLTAAPALDAPAGVVLPAADGGTRLLLGGVEGTGTATLTAYDARGRAVLDQQVELAAGLGADVELPDGATQVSLVPQGASVRAAVLATGTGGAAVVPLRPLVLTDLVPAVRPGAP